MAIIVNKKCQNGNLYIYYSNGKIKTIRPDGTVTWKTKKINFRLAQKSLFFIEKGEK
ncbi:MAG: hypothetical protein RCH30_3270 [Candidatus Phytoplasma australasiaticum]|uniref:Uncharacterized protein n=1 Tax=Peanut witches'-broom phytoplasma NTU2011 TaxID=1163385 RepID=A0ABP2TGL6_PEWBP|nr:hypothetical protein PNWB_v1c0600 [Peanut witches'-broom phytoplasma NTU2011]QLL36864.1 hypothetical protein EPWB_v2c2610 ['Echinacea purpurea' witches'-broom phytoplasma]WKV64112.1 MAG: hypothetical protein NCHU2022_c2620 [Candidatus Phytoplasma australasiaticum]WMW50213.1 MAG: hypothetical protein RCH30_3270 [Candidatus Phytoplasma australasiaticum]